MSGPCAPSCCALWRHYWMIPQTSGEPNIFEMWTQCGSVVFRQVAVIGLLHDLDVVWKLEGVRGLGFRESFLDCVGRGSCSACHLSKNGQQEGFLQALRCLPITSWSHMVSSRVNGPQYRPQHARILILRNPQNGTQSFE